MTGPRLLRYARASQQALDRNADHGFAAGQALVHYPSGAIYSFIPKNACSTMRYSLALAHGCISGPEDHTWIHNNNRTFAADLRALVLTPYSFVILRCPHRRLASVFLDKIVDRSVEYWGLNDREGHTLDPASFCFRHFVQAVARPGGLRSNVHWRPQIDFLVYEDYDDWFALERFEAVTPRLQDKTGLVVADARALTGHGTGHLDRLAPGDWADTPITELEALKRAGQVPAPGDLYDDFLRDTVWRLYRDDIRLYAARFGPEDLLFPAIAARGVKKDQT